MRRLGAGLVGALAVALLALGSTAPWKAHAADGSRVRLAWSVRPERLEHCRRLTDEELAGTPAHMRERVRCEGRAARYRLVVRTNDLTVVADTIRGGGSRHEGQIHLFRELTVAPGTIHLGIEVVRIDSALVSTDSLGGATSDRERRMEETRERVRRESLPARLALDTSLVVGPREIILIGYDAATRRLRLRRGAP